LAKLTATIRNYALKDIAQGMSNKDLIEKYDISSSAISYLKKKATGSTPQLLAFEESLGHYCPERILRLAKSEGLEPKEIARDYETTTAIMKDYLLKVWPLEARAKGTKRIVVRGANKTKTRKKRK
jgi:hypothetical protein